jgi:hypothetical protein
MTPFLRGAEVGDVRVGAGIFELGDLIRQGFDVIQNAVDLAADFRGLLF